MYIRMMDVQKFAMQCASYLVYANAKGDCEAINNLFYFVCNDIQPESGI